MQHLISFKTVGCVGLFVKQLFELLPDSSTDIINQQMKSPEMIIVVVVFPKNSPLVISKFEIYHRC
jgi:hypothetical protein